MMWILIQAGVILYFMGLVVYHSIQKSLIKRKKFLHLSRAKIFPNCIVCWDYMYQSDKDNCRCRKKVGVFSCIVWFLWIPVILFHVLYKTVVYLYQIVSLPFDRLVEYFVNKKLGE